MNNMREIKFRAWDKENKIMQNVNEINFLHNFVETYNADEVQEEYFDLDDCELMQYAGLRDRNGKEIYEGDIVTLHNSKYKVIFLNEEARFVLRDDEFEYEIPFTNNNNKRMEIIGNIYENPELLGENK